MGGLKAFLREEKHRELLRTVKFTLFSISAGVIQIASFTLLHETIGLDRFLPPFLGLKNFGWSHLIALVLSVLWNFTVNRRYTFRSDAPLLCSMLLVFLYYLVFTPLSLFAGQALSDAGWNDFLVEALTMVVNFVTEFLFQRFVVYRDRVDTRG